MGLGSHWVVGLDFGFGNFHSYFHPNPNFNSNTSPNPSSQPNLNPNADHHANPISTRMLTLTTTSTMTTIFVGEKWKKTVGPMND